MTLLMKSVLITAVAGYLGLVLGVGVLEGVASVLPPAAEFFRNPQIDLRIAIWSTVLLVVAGTFAGFFPARRAAMPTTCARRRALPRSATRSSWSRFAECNAAG